MAQALSSEQVEQITTNTLLVLLARPDLLDEWQENLLVLMQQAQQGGHEGEAIFAAAVASLLRAPDDRLPTGTDYDYAWEAILNGLQTGTIQPEDRAISLEQLLGTVAELAISVMTGAADQKTVVVRNIREVRASAAASGVGELAVWLDDVLALLDGVPVEKLGAAHQGTYAAYWQALVQLLPHGD